MFYIFSRFFIYLYLSTACEEEWRRLAQSAAETRLLSPGMQQIPNQMRATQGTPLGSIFQTDANLLAYVHKHKCTYNIL